MYKTVCALICTGCEENPISRCDGIAQIIGFYTGSQAVDDADIFVAENDLALQSLVFPVVQVCATDAGEFLFEQNRSRFWIGNGIFAYFKFFAAHHCGASDARHITLLLGYEFFEKKLRSASTISFTRFSKPMS